MAIPATSQAVVTYTDLYTLNIPASTGGTAAAPYGLMTAAGEQVVGNSTGGATVNTPHALLWNGPAKPIDLNPAGFTESSALSVSGGRQVGYGFGTATGGRNHALLWNGTNVVTDLHPVGSVFTASFAYGVGDGQQVGQGQDLITGDAFHALLWNCTNAAIDLHPTSGFVNSTATGVGGGQQVGYGLRDEPGGRFHAMLWNGTSSATNLHPAGVTESFASGADGRQRGGSGPARGEATHALLWNGSNAAVDLNRTGVLDVSFATDVKTGQEVGYGAGPGMDDGYGSNLHATYWTDTAGSAFDLHSALPAGVFYISIADGIHGNTVYGIARERAPSSATRTLGQCRS